MLRLSIYKTHFSVPIPFFATQDSACFDLSFQPGGKGEYQGYNSFNSPFSRTLKGDKIVIMPRERVMIPTGLIFDIPKGYSVRIHARSGLSLKQGLVLVNSEGVIDSDYIEEVYVLLTNTSDNSVTISRGDRIAQAEMVKKEEYIVWESTAKPFPKTERVGGIGSTGINMLPESTEIVRIKTPSVEKVSLKMKNT
jgi:dUTP pyrophosphatase